MNPNQRIFLFVLGLAAFAHSVRAADSTQSLTPPTLVFEEVNGTVAIEAEHFYKQTSADKRAWPLTTSKAAPAVKPDGDPVHVGGASGGAYLECLPDTPRTHSDKLISGENFANVPGTMAGLHYKVHFNTPGRYYVGARAYSDGPEDNGLHDGDDNEQSSVYVNSIQFRDVALNDEEVAALGGPTADGPPLTAAGADVCAPLVAAVPIQLVAADAVNGTYAVVATATINTAAKTITIPLPTKTSQFYRIRGTSTKIGIAVQGANLVLSY